jgi:hypothetical protein
MKREKAWKKQDVAQNTISPAGKRKTPPQLQFLQTTKEELGFMREMDRKKDREMDREG